MARACYSPRHKSVETRNRNTARSAEPACAAAYPFLPVRWLIEDPFRSDLRIARVNAPLLVLHGERDRVIPTVFAERRFALAREPKRFVRFPQGGHVDLDEHGAMQAVKEFLARRFD